MKTLIAVIYFPIMCVIFMSGIFTTGSCKAPKDTLLKVEMHLSDGMEGGTNMDIQIDCRQKTGTIMGTVNGVDPSAYDSIKPEKLPDETTTAILNHLNITELGKLDSMYLGNENKHLNSAIKVTTRKKVFEIEVIGNSGNAYIRKLHQMAYGIEF